MGRFFRAARAIVAAFAALAALSLAGCAAVQPVFSRSAPDFSALARTYGPAVVNIGVSRAADAAPSRTEAGSLGSGFIVSDDGYILTNAHVVARGTQIIVKLTDRREFKARLVGLDPLTDIALLKIDAAGLPTVRIGDAERAEVGDWVLAIGSPYGFSNSVTAGILSAKGRVLPGADYMPFLQTDVAINPGNSGGPLFNLRGEVIGINARIYSVNGGGNQGLAFAIPIDVAMRIKEQLQAKGSVTRGRIGVAVQELSQALAESFHLPRPAGALVSYIEAGGAAERAGLKPGDVILAVRGQEVLQSADALGWIADTAPGETVRLTIWREGAPLTLDVVVDRFAAPAARTAPASASASARAPLGLVVRSLSPQERRVLGIEEGGLLVQRVTPGTLQAGVKPGDLILALNGQPVATPQALAEDAGAIDGAMALLVQRGASRLFIPICVSKSSIGGC